MCFQNPIFSYPYALITRDPSKTQGSRDRSAKPRNPEPIEEQNDVQSLMPKAQNQDARPKARGTMLQNQDPRQYA